MFQVSIKIKSIKTCKEVILKPRFYIKMGLLHYYISDFIQLDGDQRKLNIEHKFYLPEESPEFELMLLLDEDLKSKKILGQTILDVRQWPIDDQKSRVVQFSGIVSVELSIKNSYITSIPSPHTQERSQIDQMQQMQIQLQIKEQHSFLKAKNQKLKQQLQQLSEIYKNLQALKDKKEKIMQKRNLERQIELRSKSKEVAEIKQELQHMNVQIGAIINLINDHGQIEICNSILDSLTSK